MVGVAFVEDLPAAMADFAMKDPSNLLIGQPDGTFMEGAEAAGSCISSRAAGQRSRT